MTAATGIGALLNPRSVAVIGASEDQTKFGGRLYRNLLHHGYAGQVFPINPRRAELLGLQAYPNLAATPDVPDMVVMAVPRAAVLANISEAAARGVRCAIIITSKFSDEGEAGARLEAELVAVARRSGMRLIGPNCLGMISPANRVVLCSSPALEDDNLPCQPIGFISQSGALMATVFDRARDRGIGFAHCISIGNQADLELCDFAGAFLDDDRISVICSYVEGIRDPARFLEIAALAREKRKPLLMVKAGRTDMGARATFSHTASFAGSFRAFETVCRDHGVVLMDDLDAMVLLAANLARHGGAAVRSACIVTTSGGGGAIAADRLTEAGIAMTEFAPSTQAQLAQWYSPGQAGNPVDLGGRLAAVDADAATAGTLRSIGADPAEDVILALITTAPMLADTVAGMADIALAASKPCLFVMAPGRAADAARQALLARGLPFADTLDEAVRTVRAWTQCAAPATPAIRPSGLTAAAAPSGQLEPREVEALLSAYGIPTVRQALCREHRDVLSAAARIGFPVVLKAMATHLIHKSDAGGVIVNIADDDALRDALADMDRRLGALDGYLVQQMVRSGAELIVGIKRDPQFGPMLVLGAGGIFVELLQDVVLSTVPIAPATAHALLARLKVVGVLNGLRGQPPLDIDAVVEVVTRLGWLAHDLRDHLLELDINPLLVRPHGEGCVVADARVLCG